MELVGCRFNVEGVETRIDNIGNSFWLGKKEV